MYDVQNMFSLVRSKNAYLHYVKKLLFGITSSLRGEKDEELEEGATRTEARTEVERGGGMEEGNGRPDTRFPMSTGSFYSSLRLILLTTIKNATKRSG